MREINERLYSSGKVASKSLRTTTHIAIAGKVYNALILNRIEPEIEKILRKNQTGFQKNRSKDSDNSPNHQRSTYKNNLGSTIVRRFRQNICFYTQREKPIIYL